MIKQVIDVDGYWKVIVYYDVDYNFFDDVIWEMKLADMSDKDIDEIWNTLRSNEAKAVTYNNTNRRTSIVVFNPHAVKSDYISSIVHEAEHVKQGMLKAYNIEDSGEAPAYTIGYIVSKMYDTFRKFL